MGIKKYFEAKGIGEFDEFDIEYELDDIEHGPYAKKIAEKVAIRIEHIRKIVEEFLHADGNSFMVFIETKAMDDEDYKKLNVLYKKLAGLEREFLLCDLKGNENLFVEFAKNSHIQFKEIKSDFGPFVDKIKEMWKNDLDIPSESGYLG